MTLILALANPQQVVLLSDRRITHNGQLINDNDDESNKAVILDCRNARLAVAYTGLAKARNFLTNRWLPAALMESAAPDFLMGPTIERFRERATRDFAGIQVKRPSDKRLSVVLAGYCYDDTPPRVYCWLVSNFETIDDQKPPRQEPADVFSTQYCRDKRPIEEGSHILLAIGVYRAVIESDFEALGTLLRQNKPSHALIGKGLEVIRAAAESAQSKQLIGKQCTSITLPSNPDEDAIGEYHSAKHVHSLYYPSFIKARGDGSGTYVVADPMFEYRDANNQPLPISVPKVGRNDRCPCGSGLKYKNCHGHRGKNEEQGLYIKL
jgi:hypothetical protein